MKHLAFGFSAGDRSGKTRHRWIFRTAAIVITLALGEFTLQCAARLIPAVDWILLAPYQREQAARTGLMVPDAATRWRGNPDHPAHDRLGFNNVLVPRQADLVALGDSVTYGVIGSPNLDDPVPISSALSWPAVAADLSGLTTYNMGLGGWGPVEYLHVLDEALTMNPRTVALGFYFGNDLADCFHAVYLREQYTDLADPAFAKAVAQAEAERPMFDAATGAFCPRTNAEPVVGNKPGAVIHHCRSVLSNYCKLYGLARAAKDLGVSLVKAAPSTAIAAEDDWMRASRWADQRRDRYQAFDGGLFRTVLSTPYRFVAVNIEDPRIRASLHIALEAIHRCAARCRKKGVNFVVVLLPTKELVFEPVVDEPGRYGMYREQLANEYALRDRIMADLADHGIAYVDTLHALRACFDRGVQPYAVSGDGHPNAIGYRAIATVVAEHLKRSEPAHDP